MGLFSRNRAPVDLVPASAVAAYGRRGFLGEADIGGLDHSQAWESMQPLFNPLIQEGSSERRRALEELARHARAGAWEAIGAWKYLHDAPIYDHDMVDQAPLKDTLTDHAMRVLKTMRVTNLRIHLGMGDLERYERVNGEPAPHDGFFGPPVFDSDFGPSRQYYYDAALAAAVARTPQRVPHAPGVEPGDLSEITNRFWSFAQHVFMGPLLAPADARFEPAIVRDIAAAASNVDHRLFAERLVTAINACTDPIWEHLGAGRYLEEALLPELTGSDVHTRLIDEGLRRTRDRHILGITFTAEVLTPFERSRLAASEASPSDTR